MGAVCSSKAEVSIRKSSYKTISAFEVVREKDDYIILEISKENEDDCNLRPISVNKAFATRNVRRLVATSDPNKKLVIDEIKECHDHGLLQACRLAYTYQTPLSLRPEHFWLMIIQGVAMHLYANADQLHEELAGFDPSQKVDMNIDIWDHDETDVGDWLQALLESTEAIESSLDDVADVFKASFSTTEDCHEMLYMMSLCHKQRSTEYVHPRCDALGSLSRIKLMGSEDDWEALKNCCEDLRPYGLEWWIDELEPILDNLLSSRQGNKEIDDEFWHSMYCLSGSGKVYGWIFNFFPFLKQQQREEFFDYTMPHPKRHHSDSFSCCDMSVCECGRDNDEQSSESVFTLRSVPIGLARVNLGHDQDGESLPYTFHGGFLGCEMEDEFVTPTLGWGIGRKYKNSFSHGSGYSAHKKAKLKSTRRKTKIKKKKKKKKKSQSQRSSVRRGYSEKARSRSRRHDYSPSEDSDNSRSRRSSRNHLRSYSRKKKKKKDKRKDKSDGYDSTESLSESYDNVPSTHY